MREREEKRSLFPSNLIYDPLIFFRCFTPSADEKRRRRSLRETTEEREREPLHTLRGRKGVGGRLMDCNLVASHHTRRLPLSLSLSLLGHRTPSTVLVRRRVSISPTEAHKRRERHTQSRNPRSLECNPPSLASHTASLSLPRFSPVELLCSSKSISLLHLSLSCAVAASCCSCDATIDSQEC